MSRCGWTRWRREALWQQLAERPRVAATNVKAVWLRVFDEVIAGLVLTSAVTLTGFGVIIAVGVVYNSARVALQERGWEMASLRVLGFTRQEVSRILLAELALAGPRRGAARARRWRSGSSG